MDKILSGWPTKFNRYNWMMMWWSSKPKSLTLSTGATEGWHAITCIFLELYELILSFNLQRPSIDHMDTKRGVMQKAPLLFFLGSAFLDGQAMGCERPIDRSADRDALLNDLEWQITIAKKQTKGKDMEHAQIKSRILRLDSQVDVVVAES